MPAVGLLQEGCKISGYDTQIRQDCETIIEEVCQNVTVAKFRKKIERTCKTKVRKTNALRLIFSQKLFRLTRNAKPPRLMFRSSSVPQGTRSAAITFTRRWRRSSTRRSARRRSSTCARSTSRCLTSAPLLLLLWLLRYSPSLSSGKKEKVTLTQRLSPIQISDSESILTVTSHLTSRGNL